MAGKRIPSLLVHWILWRFLIELTERCISPPRDLLRLRPGKNWRDLSRHRTLDSLKANSPRSPTRKCMNGRKSIFVGRLIIKCLILRSKWFVKLASFGVFLHTKYPCSVRYYLTSLEISMGLRLLWSIFLSTMQYLRRFIDKVVLSKSKTSLSLILVREPFCYLDNSHSMTTQSSSSREYQS